MIQLLMVHACVLSQPVHTTTFHSWLEFYFFKYIGPWTEKLFQDVIVKKNVPIEVVFHAESISATNSI